MLPFEQMDEHPDETRRQAFERVRTEHEQGETQRKESPRVVSFLSLNFEVKVFQHREGGSDSELGLAYHVDHLLQAIKREPNRRLDPITIWRCGNRWVVLDGHFRAEAYRRYAEEQQLSLAKFKLPCRVFHGSVLEAFDFSITANKKVTEPLSATERSNAAWQRVCLSWAGDAWNTSKADLVGLGLVTENTVSRMRRTLKLLTSEQQVSIEEANDLTWLDAMQMLTDPAEVDNDWLYDDELRRREAEKQANRFLRTFGDFPKEAPLFFLEALEIYSPKMVEQWTEYLSTPDEGEF
ncbi:hypothetical protein [Thalassovita sp.]|uniref:hypothetical protein n=1 Tax=Thalassovita sp. TaxID=1979401 RepID=UPI002AB0020C|nr:hypothetical protein [Thalassovita sp.]